MSPTPEDIMRELGGLTANVSNLGERIGEADASRRRIHDKLDQHAMIQNETIKTLEKLQFTLQVTTDVAVQARDGLIEFKQEFHEKQIPVISAATQLAAQTAAWQVANEPLLKNVRWVKGILIAIAGLLTIGGVSVGVVFYNANWVIKTAIKAYLDLPLDLPLG